MNTMKKGLYTISGLTLLSTASLFAGYSPTTHVSSDEPQPHPGTYSKWEYYHHLDCYEEYQLADPTYALEDDTSWPGQKEEFSDVLDPVIW